jgi:hypothetical protein
MHAPILYAHSVSFFSHVPMFAQTDAHAHVHAYVHDFCKRFEFPSD